MVSLDHVVHDIGHISNKLVTHRSVLICYKTEVVQDSVVKLTKSTKKLFSNELHWKLASFCCFSTKFGKLLSFSFSIFEREHQNEKFVEEFMHIFKKYA